MSKREVTEFDLRAPEFQRHDVKPEDYEFRDDGKVVRKDRWETTVRNIVSILGWSRREFELPEVVAEVRSRLDCGIDGDEEYESWFIGTERPCETCNGEGTIDERLGGYSFSNPAADCPDCGGTGTRGVTLAGSQAKAPSGTDAASQGGEEG